MLTRNVHWIALATTLGAIVVTGCGSDDTEPGGSGGSAGSGGSSGSAGSGGSSGSAGSGGNAGAAGGKPCVVDQTYKPTIDPAKFVTEIDNALYPLPVGGKWTIIAGDETIEIEVLPEKKEILGVSCTVVHDVASVDGEVIEDTFDWFAQDDTGAVWYFGEDTKELSGGQVTSTHGSWEAGVDGAQPGYIIPPELVVGREHRQEYYACEAEDKATVLALDETVTVPAGTFSGCLKTHDYTPLEPALNEEKYYCPDAGVVLIVDTTTQEREELTTISGVP